MAGRGQQHHEDHADVGQLPNRGSDAAGRVRAAGLEQGTHGQREEHQYDKRLRDLRGVHRDSIEEEWQDEGHTPRTPWPQRDIDSFVSVPAHRCDGPEQRYLTADGAGLCIPTYASP